MEITHGIVLPQIQGLDIGGGGAGTYMVSFQWVLKSVAYPVDG